MLVAPLETLAKAVHPAENGASLFVWLSIPSRGNGAIPDHSGRKLAVGT